MPNLSIIKIEVKLQRHLLQFFRFFYESLFDENILSTWNVYPFCDVLANELMKCPIESMSPVIGAKWSQKSLIEARIFWLFDLQSQRPKRFHLRKLAQSPALLNGVLSCTIKWWNKWCQPKSSLCLKTENTLRSKEIEFILNILNVRSFFDSTNIFSLMKSI